MEYLFYALFRLFGQPFHRIRCSFLAVSLRIVSHPGSHSNRETCTQPKFFHNGKQNRTRGRISPPPRSMG